MEKIYSLFIFLSLVFGSFAQSTSCPSGYTKEYGDFCYKFNTKKTPWDDARAACQKDQGVLVYYDSSGEIGYLKGQLKHYCNYNALCEWWTGLNKIDNKPNWNWIDVPGNGMTSTQFVTWQANEPTDNGKELCVEFNQNGLSNDNDCVKSFPYICKRYKYLTPKCDAADGWSEYGDKCLKMQTQKMSWSDAQLTCSQANGNLISIKSLPEATFLGDFIKNKQVPAFIGLKYDEDKKYWVWPDGTSPRGDGFYWDITATDKQGKNNSCVVVRTTTSQNSGQSWNVADCDDYLPSVCSKSHDTCLPGWRQFKKNCYSAEARVYELKDFTSAKDACSRIGTKLLYIESAEEQTFLEKTIFKEFFDDAEIYAWLGIEVKTSGNAQWVDNVVPFPTSTQWNNWAAGQPTFTGASQECGEVTTDDGKWSISNMCNYVQPYICKTKVDQPPVIQATDAPILGCDTKSGWIYGDDNCFKFNLTYINWFEAIEACQQDGADLVMIKNDKIYEVIKNNIQKTSWIGLHSLEKDDKYRWVDNSVATYLKWATNEPNDAKNENCVEMYSIGGNDGGLWNDIKCSATRPFICQKKATPVGVTVTPPVVITSQWDKECGPNWDFNPTNKFCYRFDQSYKSWNDARTQCQAWGGDLTSILSYTEQAFISGRIAGLSNIDMWIGLNDVGWQQGNWRWTDQSPQPYWNWDDKKPDTNWASNKQCVYMLTRSGQWGDTFCSQRYGYICKKPSTLPTTPTPTKPALTAPPGGVVGCLSGWKRVPKSDKCYKSFKERLTWQQALDKCRGFGADGNLASVSNKIEYDELDNLVYSWFSSTQYWIGLNDQKIEGQFEWSDNSPVTYTKWERNEPNNFKGNEDCVEHDSYSATWNDNDCNKQMGGYVCQTRLRVVPPTSAPPTVEGCSGKFKVANGPSCYALLDDYKRTWNSASTYCQGLGGHLASIVDSHEQAFLVLNLVQETTPYWIGLTNQYSLWTTYKWMNGDPIKYTNWESTHSGSAKNKCASFGTGTNLGVWSANECNSDLYYAVCEKTRTSGFTWPITTTHPSQSCPSGFKYSDKSDTCFKAFRNYLVTSRLTWLDARDYCRKKFGGDLASIHSNSDQSVIKSLLSSYNGNYWIGLNSRNSKLNTDGSFLHSWSDGSALQYTNWNVADGQPDNHLGQENCVEIQSKSKYMWGDINCNVVRNWVCGVKPGVTPPPTLAPVTLPTKQPNQCGSFWKQYRNSCYYFSKRFGSTERVSWHDARLRCHDYGGELTSIHDQDENNYILNQISQSQNDAFWIGLNELDLESYKWSDGSPATFFYWGKGEPNNWNSAEYCVDMRTSDGHWNDNQCNQIFNYVCKKSVGGTVSPPTQKPTVIIPGGCPAGFTAFRNKCFRFFGDNVNDKMNWTAANAKCMQIGTDNNVKGYTLAIISDELEQSFITSNLINRDYTMWIGLSDAHKTMRFDWIDNSPPYYLNWDRDQPSANVISWGNPRGTHCGIVQPTPLNAGRWKILQCSEVHGFICTGPKDPKFPAVVTKPPPGCKPSEVKYDGDCYQLITRNQQWFQANRQCEDGPGSHLVSIHNPYQQAFVHLLTQGIGAENVWIGLSGFMSNFKEGEYLWSDDWPVTYTNWGKNEPTSNAQAGCVGMNPKGKWNDTTCALQYPSICWRTQKPTPTIPPSSNTICRDGWVAYGSYCYLVTEKYGKRWSDANFQCHQQGAQLASVHSYDEVKFLVAQIKKLSQKKNKGFWIGLLKQQNGGYIWADGTGVDYKNFGEGDEESAGKNLCVFMHPTSGLWYHSYCTLYIGYVCKQAGVPGSTTPYVPTKGPQPTTPPKVKPTTAKAKPPTFAPQKQTGDSGNNAGMIVGIILAVIAIIGLAAGAAYVMRGRLNFASKLDVPTSFDNAVYNPKSNETIDIPSPGSVSFQTPVSDSSSNAFNNPTYIEPSLNSPGSDC